MSSSKPSGIRMPTALKQPTAVSGATFTAPSAPDNKAGASGSQSGSSSASKATPSQPPPTPNPLMSRIPSSNSIKFKSTAASSVASGAETSQVSKGTYK